MDSAAADPSAPVDDEVVLVDDEGNRIGTALKSRVHGKNTPLHQAFSVYVRNEHGDVLLTRRALAKLTWPGVWTGTCCGHPRPDEQLPAAIARRLADELRMTVDSMDIALPSFRYRARSAEGIVENEICPVYLAEVRGRPAPKPDPAEVAEWAWASAAAVARIVREAPFLLSPWAVAQVDELCERGLWSSA